MSVAVGLLLGAGILWVMQPYFVWRSSQAQKKDQGKISIIDTAGKSAGLDQHLAAKNKQEIELSLVVPSYNEEQRLPIMLD